MCHNHRVKLYTGEIGFALWTACNIMVAGWLSLLSGALAGLRYQEMHTLSTAMVPDPSLTRETVVGNVVTLTVQYSLPLAALAASCWALNFVIFSTNKTGKFRKAGYWLSAICTVLLFTGVILAAFWCLDKYPETLTK